MAHLARFAQPESGHKLSALPTRAVYKELLSKKCRPSISANGVRASRFSCLDRIVGRTELAYPKAAAKTNNGDIMQASQ